MRIVYGIHGYGRGHATRALALLPHLSQRHQIHVIAGGDAYSSIWPDYPVTRVPTLGFAYGRGSGRRSNWHTLRRNLAGFLDVLCRGPIFEMVRDIVREFAPDVIISDAEAWTHQVAARLAIPRISIDHIGILAYCSPTIPWEDRAEAYLDTSVYRLLMGEPQRIIVSSFYQAPTRRSGVRLVGTLPRAALRAMQPRQGDYLLVYFNRGQEQVNAETLRTLASLGCPVHLYGSPRHGREGPIHFLPMSNVPFLEDLAGCRAVVSTAGNQLMGEAIFLGKPVFVIPERCVEQRLNAAAVERLAIGMRSRRNRVSAEQLHQFLDRADEFAANTQLHRRDGLGEALGALEQFLTELAPLAARSDSPTWKLAASPLGAATRT